MSWFYKTMDSIKARVVLYVYELFISNKFEAAVRIIGIQTREDVSVCLQNEMML